MALYLGGSDKLKINVNDTVYCLNVFSTTPVIDNIRLLSFDNYVLQDSNGIYLTPKESD